MKTTSIYKSPKDKEILQALYQKKLDALGLDYVEKKVATFAGKTNVLIAGAEQLPPIVLFHGINAGTPLAMEAIKDLTTSFRIYGIDTVGQATRSAETQLPFKGDSYGRWLVEVLDALNLEQVPVIGVSYGAFILQRLIAHAPQRIQKAIFVVPSGFANGSFFKSIFKLLWPMFKYQKTKNEADLLTFMDAFYTHKDPHSIALQKAILDGIHLDTRRPPLLTKKEASQLNAPVYILAAEDDIFFPKEKTIKKAKKIFNNLKKIEILKGSKHVPPAKDYDKIAALVRGFLVDS